MRAFSLRSHCVRIWAVASIEARAVFRSHPYRLFLPVAFLVVLASPALVLFAFNERSAMVVQIGLSTASVFAVLLGIAAAAGSLPADRASRRQDLVLSHAFDPFAWLLGKWVGILLPMGAAIAAIGVVHAVNLAFTTGLPHGPAPLLLGLLVALAAGALATSLALACAALLPPAGTFLAALIILAAGQSLALLPSSPVAHLLAFVLPLTPDFNLAGAAAFGVLPGSVAALVLLNAFAYSLFALATGALLLRSTFR